VAAFEAKVGRPPLSLLELVSSGFLPALPTDPAGGELVYDPISHAIRSTVLGSRQPTRASP
jgi:hypothetical protein